MSNATGLEEDSRIRVLLVHNHEAFLRVATEFLQRHHELVVVGTARGSEEALAKAQELRPEVVLIDLRMPGPNGMATIPRLRVMLPETGIIALTLLDPNAYRQTALAAGADDFVAKANLSTDLLPAIRRVAKTARIGHEPSDFRRYTKRKDKRKTKSQLIADGQQKQNPQGGETMNLGIVGRPYPGETVSGDACFAREYGSKTLIAVVDGLGHGQ